MSVGRHRVCVGDTVYVRLSTGFDYMAEIAVSAVKPGKITGSVVALYDWGSRCLVEISDAAAQFRGRCLTFSDHYVFRSKYGDDSVAGLEIPRLHGDAVLVVKCD